MARGKRTTESASPQQLLLLPTVIHGVPQCRALKLACRRAGTTSLRIRRLSPLTLITHAQFWSLGYSPPYDASRRWMRVSRYGVSPNHFPQLLFLGIQRKVGVDNVPFHHQILGWNPIRINISCA